MYPDPTSHRQVTGVALKRAGIGVIARVCERDSTDLAVSLPNSRLGVIRIVNVASTDDGRALAEMIAAGDFDRAILIYSDKENSILSDEIETWHIDDIEHLVARLAAEAAA